MKHNLYLILLLLTILSSTTGCEGQSTSKSPAVSTSPQVKEYRKVNDVTIKELHNDSTYHGMFIKQLTYTTGTNLMGILIQTRKAATFTVYSPNYRSSFAWLHKHTFLLYYKEMKDGAYYIEMYDNNTFLCDINVGANYKWVTAGKCKNELNERIVEAHGKLFNIKPDATPYEVFAASILMSL